MAFHILSQSRSPSNLLSQGAPTFHEEAVACAQKSHAAQGYSCRQPRKLAAWGQIQTVPRGKSHRVAPLPQIPQGNNWPNIGVKWNHSFSPWWLSFSWLEANGTKNVTTEAGSPNDVPSFGNIAGVPPRHTVAKSSLMFLAAKQGATNLHPCAISYFHVSKKISPEQLKSDWVGLQNLKGSGIVLGIMFFRFWIFFWISCPVRFPCYSQHFGPGIFHSTAFCNILEFEPLILCSICNILVLELFMSHCILHLRFM